MAHVPIRSYGNHFAAQSVAQNYVHRPPYSPQVYDLLVSLMPADARAVLDAGCGPGKLALGLLPFADRLDAVDPSAEMIAIGRALPGGADKRIRWLRASVEDAPLAPPYGLIVCGVSFHWMDADVALTRFAQSLAAGGMFALVSGDAPADPPWHDAEKDMMSDFIERLQGERPQFLATSRAGAGTKPARACALSPARIQDHRAVRCAPIGRGLSGVPAQPRNLVDRLHGRGNECRVRLAAARAVGAARAQWCLELCRPDPRGVGFASGLVPP